MTPDLFDGTPHAPKGTRKPDPSGARAARDEGIQRVIDKNALWAERAMLLIQRLPVGYEGTGENIRLLLIEMGLHRPSHHNAWGGLISGAIKAKLLERTGKRAHMRTKKSHARETAVLRRI